MKLQTERITEKHHKLLPANPLSQKNNQCRFATATQESFQKVFVNQKIAKRNPKQKMPLISQISQSFQSLTVQKKFKNKT